ncbi:CRISPR-associated endoribonuclease Cas6 [Thermosipho ferrireducens]|uniref:CRISPR-associated endoribonuclease Cas6 n=1 Tax=Thermosipho ferrireducens TaxID=2571116 RepID=A0ABX7S868_9BACT|nr:CRISPR-associated endoribonuclease Cas6 [Thermosipho ferrireducens]
MNLINSDEYRKFIHDEGFAFEKRKFKLYTFSRLLGNFEINKEKNSIMFFNKVKLIISSMDDNFCNYLMQTLLKFGEIRLGRNILQIDTVIAKNFEPADELKVVTRSPVTVYSTYLDNFGRKKTLFYHPDDKKFQELLEKNLIKKYQTIHSKLPEGRISVIHAGKKPKKVQVIYKGFKITGWMTAFDLYGDPMLLKIAYETGLGAKNSLGFGLIETIKK